ncbi:MAG: neutral/alkaline non-lysosomal ceramidase N-terminal domain-containing protein, partial [Planctomycetaceae bacterium]|nr:neutral/alkaline non-lysosomal ceramidase N-terminal domain-containing protein [Planctomycetaceae bacterium]
MRRTGRLPLPLILILLALFQVSSSSLFAADFQIGFSKQDITPTEPVRLSGYGNRTETFERVEEPLFVRTMAIQHGKEPIHVLSSVEGIGLAGIITKQIAERLEQEFGISRERFALTNTHSHTAPHTSGGIPNLYSAPLTEAETAAMDRYTKRIEDQLIASVDQAIKSLAPAQLSWGEGASRLAMNRRIIKGGVCVGMGPNPDGIIDETLPILKISSPDGKLRGIVFNYACHCTTLVPKHNFINGDWAGYAQKFLEEAYPDTIALCTIGCGADANPEPRGEFEHAIQNGRTIADEVQRVLKTELDPIQAAPEASFGYAGLEYDRRDVQEFRDLLNDSSPQVRRHAANMVEVYERKRRLPETYPMPIQTWAFGDELTMVFLGGEVVSPYAHRIRQELSQSKHTWVTAYANDVFGYVASEEMIQQGGYEVDFSQVYYNHPGPWASGTEDLVLKRVKEIKENPVEGARSPEEAVNTWKLPKGYEIELVASEPLIADPVNFNFGPDGRLWVVQMSDYPKGLKNEGIPGGQVRVLSDTDGDGKMDKAEVFIEGLSYPTGVMPWRKGAIVSCAPDIFYAEDTNGDGKADHKQVLYTGFVESNPQHRINGFAWGLDNWVHVGSGAPSDDITAVLTGKVINMSNLDIRIRPDTDEIETESGRTQYGRVRDDWGHWFGSDNSKPIYHYVISDRYLRRNKFFPAPAPAHDLLDPPVAPPVFPASRTVDRFNDLYAANRFTSACGEGIFRDVTLGSDFTHSAFVCEPVHNLVSRAIIEDDGVTFKGVRAPEEQDREFLASTDVWARPVRITTGPDGALWFADMYRHVIEHPQWIPDDWQKMLNVRAGEDKGRIYRVYKTGNRPQGPLPDLQMLDSVELAEHLKSSNGPVRDLTQQLLIHREDSPLNLDLLRSLKQIALHAPLPA